MIYEVRTYDLKPGSLAPFLKLFAEGYEHRKQYSEMSGLWYTEIGPLNQVVHIWPYASVEERLRIRGEAVQNPHWPPPVHEHIVRMESEIYLPFPFSPELKPGKLGPVYEMRIYTVKPGIGLASVRERWAGQLPERVKFSPLAAVMYTENGELNKYFHLWPYASLDERARIRKAAMDAGAWPPPGGPGALVTQQNKILLPAACSPMQ